MLSGSHHITHAPGSRLGLRQRLHLLFTGETFGQDMASYRSQRLLNAATNKVVQVHGQVERLQAQHHLELTRLAQAYQDLSPEGRAALPEKLRRHLDRIEAEYF
ncbi:MAG TPA: hypothetical protein V6D19_22890 [Stenomitos sp.]